MAQYIQKFTLVAEINKRIIDAPINNIGHQRVWAYNDVKDILDTLEVKEVDLEKEFCDYLEKNFRISMTGILLSNNGEPINTIKLFDFAKHFFELGLKAQKGE